jgi:hypothetical protein
MVHLLKYTIEAGAAAVGYILGDSLVKKSSGKHIHQHVFKWWCELRERIQNWLHQRQHLGFKKLGLAVLVQVDGVAVRAKKIADKLTSLLGFFATDGQRNLYEIETVEVSTAEALRQFPELREHTVLLQEL